MTASENAKVVLLSTCPQDAADGLARFLVEERHAACVNIIPAVRSVYRWQGAIESATESLLVIKTTAAAADALTRALVERHPYSVPEVVGFAIDSGHAPYLDWIADETRGTET
ncbi:MAG TPA: divalent-cation tolerance protein CutA [Planctomycetota bacterium]|nr:divalent-cation tolerance protein CutA [Planctomycetota bacterium]